MIVKIIKQDGTEIPFKNNAKGFHHSGPEMPPFYADLTDYKFVEPRIVDPKDVVLYGDLYEGADLMQGSHKSADRTNEFLEGRVAYEGFDAARLPLVMEVDGKVMPLAGHSRINWAIGNPPVRAVGMGGRQVRTGPEYGQIFDHFAVDYEYPNGVHVMSMCRQIPGTQGDNSNIIYCTGGRCTIRGGNSGASIVDRDGKEIWSMKGDIGAAYKQEHKDLIDSIRNGKPIVELKNTADSSMTAALGRMAAYTGKNVTWDFATNESKLDLFPEDFDIDGARPEPEFAIPGKTPLI